MHNEFQTAANSKNHVGDAPAQISAAQIERLVNEYKKTRTELEWAIGSRATQDTCAFFWGKKDALNHVFDVLGIDTPEEI